jgi:hypothetical protein
VKDDHAHECHGKDAHEHKRFLGEEEMEERIKEITEEHGEKKNKIHKSGEALEKKLEEWKCRHELKDTKTVMVTATDWNQKLGLLAVALID